MQLMSFSDLVFAMGCQQFNMALLLQKLQKMTDDARREALALEILKRRKLLRSFKDDLQNAKAHSITEIAKSDLRDIEVANACVTALAICDISQEKNLKILKDFIIKIVQSNYYDVTKLKKDCQVILSENTELSFQNDAIVRMMHKSISYNDLIMLYEKAPSWFKFVFRENAESMMQAISIDLSLIEIDQLIAIIFETCKKRALSVFVKSKDADSALQVYIDCFKQILDYEEFDIDKYVDLASDSLINLEGVIM